MGYGSWVTILHTTGENINPQYFTILHDPENRILPGEDYWRGIEITRHIQREFLFTGHASVIRIH